MTSGSAIEGIPFRGLIEGLSISIIITVLLVLMIIVYRATKITKCKKEQGK